MPVDPTVQGSVPPAEPLGVAPKPEPIGGGPPPTNDIPPVFDPVAPDAPPAAPAAPPVADAPPPGWIREAGAELPTAAPQPPPQGPPPQQFTQQPPQGHPPQQMSPEDMALNAIVNNPRGFIGSIVNEALEQRVDPAFRSMSETAGSVNNYLTAKSREGVSKAQSNVERLYAEVFQQDEAYNSNPNVKKDVDQTFYNLLEAGVNDTKGGHFDRIIELGGMTNLQAQAALNAVKTVRGVVGSPVNSPNVGTAVVERPTSSGGMEPSVPITQEEEQIIAFRERIDPGFRARFTEAKKVAIEKGDFELG